LCLACQVTGERLDPRVERKLLGFQHDAAHSLRRARLEVGAADDQDVAPLAKLELNPLDPLVLRQEAGRSTLDSRSSGQRLLELVSQHPYEGVQIAARSAKRGGEELKPALLVQTDPSARFRDVGSPGAMSLLLGGRTGYTGRDCFVMAAGRRMLGHNQGLGSWTPAAMTPAKEQFGLNLILLNAGHLREPSASMHGARAGHCASDGLTDRH
jgi:hypothetical protein